MNDWNCLLPISPLDSSHCFLTDLPYNMKVPIFKTVTGTSQRHVSLSHKNCRLYYVCKLLRPLGNCL